MRFLLLLLFFQVPAFVFSQLSGTVTLEYAGVQFTIPDGWIGQQIDGVLELRFTNGETVQYALQYVNDQTLLSGTRNFRTYDVTCQ